MTETELVMVSILTDDPIRLFEAYSPPVINSEQLIVLHDMQQHFQYIKQALTIESSSEGTIFSPSFKRVEPILKEEEIDVGEWKKALLYDKKAIDDLVQKILADFDIERSSSNIQWFYKQIEDMLSTYEKESNLKLPEETYSMLKKLMIRMTYDKLCIKSL